MNELQAKTPFNAPVIFMSYRVHSVADAQTSQARMALRSPDASLPDNVVDSRCLVLARRIVCGNLPAVEPWPRPDQFRRRGPVPGAAVCQCVPAGQCGLIRLAPERLLDAAGAGLFAVDGRAAPVDLFRGLSAPASAQPLC